MADPDQQTPDPDAAGAPAAAVEAADLDQQTPAAAPAADPDEQTLDQQRPTSSMSEGWNRSAGMGEEDMMAFFRNHMESILKPFAENVEEIHRTAQKLANTVVELQEKSLKDTKEIEKHAEIMKGMQNRQDKLIERAEATRTILEGNIDETKKDSRVKTNRMDKVDETIESLKTAIEEVRKHGKDEAVKVVRLQEVEKTTRKDLYELQNEISRVEKNLGKSDEAHEAIVEQVKRNKLAFNDHVKQFKELEQEQRYLRAKFVALENETGDQLKKVKARNEEVQSTMLQHRQQSEQRHEEAAKVLAERKDVHEEIKKDVDTQLKKLGQDIANESARIDENDKEYRQLFVKVDKRHVEDMQKARSELANLGQSTSDIPSMVEDMMRRAMDRIIELEQEGELNYKRTRRLENVLQLEEMTKENADTNPRVSLQHGMLLTEDQLQEFQDQFDKFDQDKSGSVSANEVGDILSGLGFDVGKDVVELVMNEIDADRSGEINFEEFCAMMTKMLGPDGKLNIDGYMKNITESASREARQNEIVELFPFVQDEIKKHQKMLSTAQAERTSTAEELQNLLMAHSKLQEEVGKLRKGLELNDGYWKGMTRGFKDTKNTVHKEGDGAMLPSAVTLRRALPPLGSLSSPLKPSILGKDDI